MVILVMLMMVMMFMMVLVMLVMVATHGNKKEEQGCELYHYLKLANLGDSKRILNHRSEIECDYLVEG